MKAAGVIATGFGVGLSPFMPGTLGSLWGVALAAATHAWPLGAKLALLAGVTAVGVWASERAGRAWGHDHPQIVIDEAAGQYLTLLAAPSASWYLWGLLLFRAADMIKPFPASYLDRKKGGWYTMADDLAAGLYGLAALAAAAALFAT